MIRKWRSVLIIVAIVFAVGMFKVMVGCSNDAGSSCVGYGGRCSSTSDCCDDLICDDAGQLPGIYVCQ